MSVFYNRTSDFIEMTIRDCTGKRIERFKCKLTDRRACTELMKRLKDKYGFEPLVPGSNWIAEDVPFN